MQKCWTKFSKLSNEGDIINLNYDVINRLSNINNNIKSEIDDMENKIKNFIHKINYIILNFQNGSSKYNEKQIYKVIQQKEELEKLEIKLKVSIDKNDIIEIKNKFKSITKTN